MNILLNLKVFSLDFYLFLIFLFIFFIEIADIRGDPNPCEERGIGTGDRDGDGDGRQNPKLRRGVGPMSPLP